MDYGWQSRCTVPLLPVSLSKKCLRGRPLKLLRRILLTLDSEISRMRDVDVDGITNFLSLFEEILRSISGKTNSLVLP